MNRQRFRLADDTAWLAAGREQGSRTYVARLPDGPIVVLEGSSELIFRTALDVDDLGVDERVARETGLAVDVVRADVETFVGALVREGLLVAQAPHRAERLD